MRKTIIPSGLEGVHQNLHFAPAVMVGDTIYCSGIVGIRLDQGPPGNSDDASLRDMRAVEDPQAQFATAFEILKAILAEAGAELSDIVEMTTYFVDVERHVDLFTAVRDQYLSDPYPAWTFVGGARLLVPDGLMEMRVIAHRGS